VQTKSSSGLHGEGMAIKIFRDWGLRGSMSGLYIN